jgi:hypothetical protein
MPPVKNLLGLRRTFGSRFAVSGAAITRAHLDSRKLTSPGGQLLSDNEK